MAESYPREHLPHSPGRARPYPPEPSRVDVVPGTDLAPPAVVTRGRTDPPSPLRTSHTRRRRGLHQPLARRMGLWFTVLSALVLGAMWLFAVQGGWVIPPIAFLAAFGLIVGLTMTIAPGPRVSDTELDTSERRTMWGRLDRTHKAIWTAAMLLGIPIAGAIAWTLTELSFGI